ncbi:hypothetical protein [Alienimonas californiensis]|uniref:Uncharacterized protein n=1 Tax=Alienimonas californiensis TaxID=2527989 RepID=A0A517P4N7_9PLAN|nr:hypothetical protein [Alienimonas californiensis]QDT14333.1 hypothetical protein CA12_04050 [Alienimonas californiensis]
MPDAPKPSAPSGTAKPPSADPNVTEDSPPDGDGSAGGEGSDDGEVELLITPRAAALDELQVTEEEFEWALGRALDLLEEAPEDEEVAAVEDLEIQLNGRTFRLEEVAEIEIGGDLSELGPLPDPADDDWDDDGANEEE